MEKKSYITPNIIVARISVDYHLLQASKMFSNNKWWFWDADQQKYFDQDGNVMNEYKEEIPADDARGFSFSWEEDWE